jgi:hypothetical protein
MEKTGQVAEPGTPRKAMQSNAIQFDNARPPFQHLRAVPRTFRGFNDWEHCWFGCDGDPAGRLQGGRCGGFWPVRNLFGTDAQ